LRPEKGVSKGMGWFTKPLCRAGISALLLLAVWASGSEGQLLSEQMEESDGSRLLRNRSPRLAGMGLLRIAVEDENNELNLFDYVGSPAGLLADRDSTSVDFQFDLARHRTSWTGVDPLYFSPAGRHYPAFLEFAGGADVEERFGFERYDVLATFRRPGNLGVGARVKRVSGFVEDDISKYDVTFVRAIGEEEETMEPDTLFVPAMSRDSISRVEHWLFDVIVDKHVGSGLVVGGHAVFTIDDRAPEIFHSPDSMITDLTKVTVVDTFQSPDAAIRRAPYPLTEGKGDGIGGGLAFSYELNRMVTVGAAGDIMATDGEYDLKGAFFRQEMKTEDFRQTGSMHGLFKLGRVLEGAVKHSSTSGDGSGEYFWSYGCPVQGGGFDFLTLEGETADKDYWEERTGTRWLLRVPQTSIKLSVEYESNRGNYTVVPDSAYDADVFGVPGECAGGEGALNHPRYALVFDNNPIDYDFREKTLTAGASLTLWFGRRPLSLATEYESWNQEWEEATEGPGSRDLSMIKLGSEVAVSRSVTVRVGGVWGEDRVARGGISSVFQRPLEGVWTERTFTLGGTYVLIPGLRQIEVAYMYSSREPDFKDIYDRETKDHRITAYTRFYF